MHGHLAMLLSEAEKVLEKCCRRPRDLDFCIIFGRLPLGHRQRETELKAITGVGFFKLRPEILAVKKKSNPTSCLLLTAYSS